MNTPDFTNKWSYKGQTIVFKVYFTHSFKDVNKPKQCYGIVLDDNKQVLIISTDGKEWNFPGGGIEKDETFEETLTREVYEEAAVVIHPESIKPFFYQTASIQETGEFEGTQLRFIAKVKSMDKFVNDPGGDTKFQKFVSIDEIPKYIKWSGVENEIVKRIADYI